MDSWKPAEIASMKVGGNANMLEWWRQHDLDPRMPIPAKYGHQTTQNYRDKIKALIAGQDYVEPKLSSSSSSSVRKSPKSSSSSSSSASSGALRKSKKKSSSGKSSKVGTPVTGKMFSFDDSPNARGEKNDSSDDEFESFVTEAPKTVQSVPDYSDSRLNRYAGASSFGSDDLEGKIKNEAQGTEMSVAVDDMFAALGAGWSRLTEATVQTKEKLEQSNLTGKASSLISSLWAGTGATSEPVKLYPEPEERPAAAPKEWAPGREENKDAGGWGAWDGDADDEPVAQGEDAWGAWDASKKPEARGKEEKKPIRKTTTTTTTTTTKEAPARGAGANQLIDLNFDDATSSPAPVASSGKSDGWDDFAFGAN